MAPRRARSVRRTQPRGFTLIEVLVALTIVAIALGAGIKAAGALTDNTQRVGEVVAAQWCAENQLTGMRLSGLTPSVGDSDFSCTQLGQAFRGRLTVRPTPNPLFVNADAQIFDENDRPVVNLMTVLRKP